MKREVDVLVVGGGSAGVAAAVAAAGSGATVLLIERLGSAGGQAVSAYVGTVCGLWLRTLTDLPVWASGGWPRSMGQALAARCGTRAARTRDGLWYLPYTPFELRGLLDEALADAGVDTWFHTTLHGGEWTPGGSRIRALAFDRPAEVEARAVIDASGQATAALALGAAPLPLEGGHQAPAYVLHVEGLPEALSDDGLKMVLLRSMMRGVQEGALSEDALALSVVPGSRRGTYAACKLGLRGTLPDDPAVFSATESRARATAARIFGWLAEEEAGMERVRVIDAAPQVGFRSGRRAKTRQVCTAADLRQLGSRDDGVARAAWPVERWGADARPRLGLLPEGQAWEIPAGALEVEGRPGVWVAGRTLGADEEALASARVIGTCWQTGWAAGRLAAGYTRGEDRAATIAGIRRELALSNQDDA